VFEKSGQKKNEKNLSLKNYASNSGLTYPLWSVEIFTQKKLWTVIQTAYGMRINKTANLQLISYYN